MTNFDPRASLPGIGAKIARSLATHPEHFVTHPAELRVLHALSPKELDDFARERGWRIVRRVGGRHIEFYNDAGQKPLE